ncbi:MAG: hypothetical protein HY587_03970 [Candidatus Omnitrophica bacterium]|nr:hypothetical protein [Candidatus Omnitrophota bacterium]
MKASMLTKMLAIMTCVNLAALPVYAQEVTLGEHSIDVTGIETVCEHPEQLDLAISETYNELLAENPEVAEIFTQELTELAETVADTSIEEATVEVVETVAEVAPQLVQSVTQTQDGTVNVDLAGQVQNFLGTASQVLADQPEMVGMLNAADQQLEFGLANMAFQEAGIENMGDFMKNIMDQRGGDPEAMRQAAAEFFAQHGEEFASLFENGVPDFIGAQCDLFGEAFSLMETHGQELFAGGEFHPEVMGAAYEGGPVPPEIMAMMENFGEGMDPSQMEFNPEMFQEMFMEHSFEGGDYGFPMEGEHWGPEGMDFFQHEGEFVFDPAMMEAMGLEFEAMMQEHMTEWENFNTGEQIDNRNQDIQQQMGECLLHSQQPPHDANSDGHAHCQQP